MSEAGSKRKSQKTKGNRRNLGQGFGVSARWGGKSLLNYKAKIKKPHDFDAQRSLQISTSNVYVRRYVFRRPTRTLLAKWGHRAAREPPEQRKQYSRKPGAGGEGARARQARALRAPLARLRRSHRPLPQAQPAPAPHPAGATEEFSHRDQRSVASNPCACLDRFGVNPLSIYLNL